MNQITGTVRGNLAGAWAVMNGRAQGLAQLDLSVAGFWKSFAAILLIVPFAALALIGERVVVAAAGEALAPVTSNYVFWRALALLADWLAFPLVFAVIAPPLGLGRHFVPFIIARNWASVIAMAFAGLAYALLVTGVVPPSAAPFLLLIVLGLALRFAYCVARIALAVPVSVAIPIVILDLVVSLVVEAAFGLS